MTNGDRIRSMSDEELNKFLWQFKLSEMSAFLKSGGVGVMDVVEQKLWLQSQDNSILEELMNR